MISHVVGIWLPKKTRLALVLRPDEISVEDLLIADDGDRQYRQKQEQREDGHLFAMGQRGFAARSLFLDDGRIGRKIFSAGQIDRQADQHADAGRAESPMPAYFFAEGAGNERRGDDSAIDEEIVNLESVGAPVVACCG